MVVGNCQKLRTSVESPFLVSRNSPTSDYSWDTIRCLVVASILFCTPAVVLHRGVLHSNIGARARALYASHQPLGDKIDCSQLGRLVFRVWMRKEAIALKESFKQSCKDIGAGENKYRTARKTHYDENRTFRDRRLLMGTWFILDIREFVDKRTR